VTDLAAQFTFVKFALTFPKQRASNLFMSLMHMKQKLDKLAELSRLAKGLEDASLAERIEIERKFDLAVEELAELLQPAHKLEEKFFPATQSRMRS
jgi:hypothetical protein